MPFVQISLRQGQSALYRQAVSVGVQQALMEAFNAAQDDLLQVVTEYPENELIFHPRFVGNYRSAALLLIQITCNIGRSTEMKRALYARIVQVLAEDPGVASEDVVIMISELPKENWSFGNGVMQGD